jgi:CheY-like chemotaxis protein
MVVIPTNRVLVIDDDAPVQMVVQSCFEELAGWEVLTADSGAEGLAKAIAEPPDVIILDMMMPGMDGLTFLQHLKANPKTQAIPVVILTARTDLLQSYDYSAYGVVRTIAKPFDPISLVDQVAQALG